MYARETHDGVHQERQAQHRDYNNNLEAAIVHPIQHLNQEEAGKKEPDHRTGHSKDHRHKHKNKHHWWQGFQPPSLGGGGKLKSGIGNVPGMGSVPADSTTQSSGSPLVIIVLIAGAAAIGFLIWNKLHHASHDEKQMNKEESKEE